MMVSRIEQGLVDKLERAGLRANKAETSLVQALVEIDQLRELIDGAIKVLAHHGHDVLAEAYQRALAAVSAWQ